MKKSNLKLADNAAKARLVKKQLANQRAGRTIRNTEKWCPKCKKIKARKHFREIPSKFDTQGRHLLYAYCKPCQTIVVLEWADKNNPRKRERQRVYRLAVRDKVFTHYGGKCTCCGEFRIEFLTLDHIMEDGATHRKTGVGASNLIMWAQARNYPNTIQILCWNCNHAKHIYGECPHKTTYAIKDKLL